MTDDAPLLGPQIQQLRKRRRLTLEQLASLSGVSSQRKPDKPRVYAAIDAPDSETTLDGNQVVLEEQMLKMNEARGDYDAAVGFYQKALSMLHEAVHKPGT